MIDDPVVEEVRAIRRKIWEECGEDWTRYFERLRQAEAEHPERLVTVESERREPVHRAKASQPKT